MQIDTNLVLTIASGIALASIVMSLATSLFHYFIYKISSFSFGIWKAGPDDTSHSMSYKTKNKG